MIDKTLKASIQHEQVANELKKVLAANKRCDDLKKQLDKNIDKLAEAEAQVERVRGYVNASREKYQAALESRHSTSEIAALQVKLDELKTLVADQEQAASNEMTPLREYKTGDYYSVTALSNSTLSAYEYELLKGKPRGSSDAFRFGRAVHEYILEPHKFDPKNDNVTPDELEKIQAMAKSVEERLFDFRVDAEFEKEYFWEVSSGAYVFRAKGKLDVVTPDYILDFKTTRQTNIKNFEFDAKRFGYPKQAAWYLDIPEIRQAGIDVFYIVGVSKVEPYPCFVLEYRRGSQDYTVGLLSYTDIMGIMVENGDAWQYLADDAWTFFKENR